MGLRTYDVACVAIVRDTQSQTRGQATVVVDVGGSLVVVVGD